MERLAAEAMEFKIRRLEMKENSHLMPDRRPIIPVDFNLVGQPESSLRDRLILYEEFIRKVVEEVKLVRAKRLAGEYNKTDNSSINHENPFAVELEALKAENKSLHARALALHELLKERGIPDSQFSRDADRTELIALRVEVKHLRDLLRVNQGLSDSVASLIPPISPSQSSSSIMTTTPPRSPLRNEVSHRLERKRAPHNGKQEDPTRNLNYDQPEELVDDIADVGPPLSPTAEVTTRLDPNDSEADLRDRAEIQMSSREVDSDLGD